MSRDEELLDELERILHELERNRYRRHPRSVRTHRANMQLLADLDRVVCDIRRCLILEPTEPDEIPPGSGEIRRDIFGVEEDPTAPIVFPIR